MTQMETQNETQNVAQKTQEIVKRIIGVPFKKGNPGGGRIKLTAEQKLIKQAAKEAAIAILTNHSPRAARKITKLSDRAKSESVQLAASQDTLDRVGIVKEKEPSGDKETLNITFILNSFKVEK